MYYTYILKLSDGRYYAGFTGNLDKRFKKHMQKSTVTTKNRIPIKVVFYAAFSTKDQALEFERYLKSLSGKAFRNKRLI